MFAHLRKMIINMLSTKEEQPITVNVTPTNNNKTFNEELEELEERRLQNRKSLASKVFDEKYEAQERSTGVFHVDDLCLIQNQRARSAVAGLGSWTALANAVRRFTTEMDKTAARRNPAKWEPLLEEFHMWNSMSPTTKSGLLLSTSHRPSPRAFCRATCAQEVKGRNSSGLKVCRNWFAAAWLHTASLGTSP